MFQRQSYTLHFTLYTLPDMNMALVDYSDSEEEDYLPSGRQETGTSVAMMTSGSGTGVTLVNDKTDDGVAFFGLFGGDNITDQNVSSSHDVATHPVHSVDDDHKPQDESTSGVMTIVSGSDSGTCCSMCGCLDVLYRCPACHRRSCGLNCCRKHKQEFNCNGIRNRIPFLRVSEFTDKHLVDDYFVLQGITDEIERKIRNRKAMRRFRVVGPKVPIERPVRDT